MLSGPPALSLEGDLLDALATARTCDIAAAFVTDSGVRLLEEQLRSILRKNGGRVRIVTGDYLGFNEPRTLRRLLDFGHTLELYVHEAGRGAPLHAKSYLLTDDDGHRIAYVGSSNLTRSAMRENVEWNVRLDDHLDALATAQAFDAFAQLMADSRVSRVNHAWIDAYECRRPTRLLMAATEVPAPAGELEQPNPSPISPSSVQAEALAGLSRSLEQGDTAGLVVMATGLGKTILAALFQRDNHFDRCLFVAHREEILDQATSAFRRVNPDAKTSRIDGHGLDFSGDLVFASVQTLSRPTAIQAIPSDAFDLVVVDEFHHADAPTYRRVIDRFTPRYLLGLTATPERSDRGDILALCNDRLVYQCGVRDGIRQRLLAPFSYFGIADAVDYSQIPWRNGRFDPSALEAQIATEARATRALFEWRKHIGLGRPTIAFCASARHADFMRNFTRSTMTDVRCAAVHSGPTSDSRREGLDALGKGELDILYCVDMFNEGVDVPEIEGVLMLRPTTSPIIFQQQFGRGLRFRPGKMMTAVDFVGNHRSFMIHLMMFLGDPSETEVADRLQSARATHGLIELDSGCSLHYELAAIDLLEQAARARQLRRGLEDWYRDYCSTYGRRPTFRTAMERGFFGPGGAALGGQEQSWAGLVARLPGSHANPTQLSESMNQLLDIAQRTPMTRCFKMLVLEAFAEATLPEAIPIEHITEHFHRRAIGDGRVGRDIGFDTADRARLRRQILDNPVHAWTTPNATMRSPLFALEADRLVLRPPLLAPERSAAADIMLDIVEGRLWSYFNRPRGRTA